MYEGLEVDYLVNPKATQDYRLKDSNNKYSEWPFIEARVNGNAIHFDDFINEDSTLNDWNIN
jgi:hypothetical protein